MSSTIQTSISNRKSELAFDPKDIDNNTIKLLFEAARWAPSSYNEQPWRFYYATRSNIKSFQKLLALLASGNSEWAKNASLLVFTTARRQLTLNGKENTYALHDTGMATANLLIQAEFMGLATHPMGGFDKNEAVKLLNLSNDYLPVTAIAVGYKGESTQLSEANQKRSSSPRVRKPLKMIAIELLD